MWSALSNSSGVLGAIEDKIAQAGASIKISSSAFKSCTIARISAAWANLAITVGTIVKDVAECFGTGPGCLFVVLKDSFKKMAEEAAKAGLKSLLISIITNFATKKITDLFKRSVIQKAVGEDLGNVLVSGGNAYMGMNHRQNGGSVADKDSLVSYYQAQDRVIAENARYERESRSPFDITSKYTFMGSIAAQLVPLASSMTSITNAINGASGVIGSAISSLSPKSSAVSAGIRAQAVADATAKANPYLADLGGVGDAFGNPYIITDTKTLGNHPADIVNDVDALSQNSSGEKKNLLDVDDPSAENVPKIGKNSNLAKYIVYCGQRQSPFGMADQNIAAEIDKTDVDGGETKVGQGAAAFANGALSAVPVLGDTLDITSNQTKLDNMGWISGESCVTNNDANKYSDKSIGWGEAKKYQRFIEDQRLAEAEGLIEKSAVTEYLAEYYEEHPLDNSLEGVLARYSGYTKENVAYALNLMDVMNFVAEYDPTNLYPYPHQEQPEQQIEIDNQYDYYNNDMLAMHSVVYNDLRYRNHAA